LHLLVNANTLVRSGQILDCDREHGHYALSARLTAHSANQLELLAMELQRPVAQFSL
jgi:hypothetical protein